MRNFLSNLIYKFNCFMYGRYGSDILNKHLTFVILALLILSYIPYMWPIWFVALAIVIWCNFRMFSKNISARRKELDVYLRFINKISAANSLRKQKFQNRKTHKYYKCKKCKANLRVPKGKGKIEITCPKCKNVMIKTT